jgi:hypothetical protein
MTQLSDLNQLEAAWNAARQGDGRIAVQPALLPAGDVSAFLGPLPQPLVLQNAVLTRPDPTRLDVDGVVAGTWSVPPTANGRLSDIHLKLVFRKALASDPITGTLMVPGATLSLAGKQAPVGGQLLPGTGLLSLKLAPQNGPAAALAIADLLNDLGGPTYGSGLPTDVPSLNGVKLSDIALTFGFAPSASTLVAVSADAETDWSLVDGKLTLQKIGVTAQIGYVQRPGDDELQTSFAANLHGTAKLGAAEVQATLSLIPDGVYWLDVSAQNGSTLPGLSDLASFLGGSDLVSTVSDGLQSIDLGDIAIDGVSIGIDLQQKQPQFLSLRSHMLIAGGRVELYTFLPDFSFYGGLPQNLGLPATSPPISVTALASHLLGETADLPNLNISGLWMYSHPALGTYRIAVETQEGWTWQIGSGLALTLANLGFNFTTSDAGVTGGLDATFELGGFTLMLSGQYLGKGAGWQLTGRGVQTTPVALGTFIGDLAQKLGAPAPTDLINAAGKLEIDAVELAINTQDKSFQFLCDVTTKGTVPLGSASTEVDLSAYVSSTVDAGGKRSFAGHLEGDLTIGKEDFVVTFDFGAANVFKARWRSDDGSTIGFDDIAGALGIAHDITVPHELDLGLKAAAFEYYAATTTFVLSAESAKFGDAFFTAGKGQDGRFGFVFGVDLPPHLKLSELPGIGPDLKPADFLTLKQGAILLSSGTFASYVLPTLPPLPPATPATSGPWVGPVAGSGRRIKPMVSGPALQLTPGLSLATIIDFGATRDVRARNLQQIVRKNELTMQATIGQQGLKLFASLAGNAMIPGGKSRLTLLSPMVRIDFAPEVAFQLSGGVAFKVNGTPVTATARILIDETEAEVAVDISGQQAPLPPPPGIKGLHIRDFGVEMGLFFAPPGLDIGLAGTFTVGGVQKLKDDNFGIVLEVLEEAANILYLAFYLDQLDLGQVVTLFTDRSEPGLIRNLEFVKASDLSFHWCDSVVALPDGSLAPPGFGFSASLDILGWGAHAELQVGVSDGIHGNAELAPLHLKDVLTIVGGGKGMKRTYEQVGGTWQQVDNTAVKRQLPAPPRRSETVVAPGGAVIAFNCLKPPFLDADFTVTLFDAVNVVVKALVDQSGFGFHIGFDVAGIDHFTLDCTLHDKDHFGAGADVKIGIDRSVGPIHVSGIDCGRLHVVTKLVGRLGVTLDPSRFSLTLDGSFDFEGLHFNAPHLALDVAPKSLADLPPKIADLIASKVDFSALFADATKYANMVKRGVVTGAGDVAATLKSAYHKSDQEAADVLRAAGYGTSEVTSEIKGAYGSVVDAGGKVVRGAESAADKVKHGVESAADDVKHGAESAGDEIKKDADKVGDFFKHL